MYNELNIENIEVEELDDSAFDSYFAVTDVAPLATEEDYKPSAYDNLISFD
jgi:hypothetical protein